jgi:hypothetical protein
MILGGTFYSIEEKTNKHKNNNILKYLKWCHVKESGLDCFKGPYRVELAPIHRRYRETDFGSP